MTTGTSARCCFTCAARDSRPVSSLCAACWIRSSVRPPDFVTRVLRAARGGTWMLILFLKEFSPDCLFQGLGTNDHSVLYWVFESPRSVCRGAGWRRSHGRGEAVRGHQGPAKQLFATKADSSSGIRRDEPNLDQRIRLLRRCCRFQFDRSFCGRRFRHRYLVPRHHGRRHGRKRCQLFPARLHESKV